MLISVAPVAGEALSRAVERAVAEEIDGWPGCSATLRSPNSHGGDIDVVRPDGEWTIVEVKSLRAHLMEHDGVNFDATSLKAHFRRADRDGADRVVLVAGHVEGEPPNLTFACGALDGMYATALARQAQASNSATLRFALNHSDLAPVREILGAV